VELAIGCTHKAYVASARRIWDSFHGEEMGIEIQLAQNVRKIKEKKIF
jgi:hypothetical protein